MGRFFTYSDVLDGAVPRGSDFDIALTHIMNELKDMVEIEWIISALPYGSVMRKEPTVRSDIDLLVITHNDSFQSVLNRLRQVGEEIYLRYHVPISDKNIVPLKECNGTMTMGPGYLSHVYSFEGKTTRLGESPGPLITPGLDETQELKLWFGKRIKSLSEAISNHATFEEPIEENDHYLKFISIACDVFSLGPRKILGHEGVVESKLTKAQVIQRLGKLDPQLGCSADQVRSFVLEYENVVKHMAGRKKGPSQREEYRKVLRIIEKKVVPEALKFIFRAKEVLWSEELTRT